MQIEVNIEFPDLSKKRFFIYLRGVIDRWEEKEKKAKKLKRQDLPTALTKLANSFFRYWVVGVVILIALVIIDQVNQVNNTPTLFPSFEAFKTYGYFLLFSVMGFSILLVLLSVFYTIIKFVTSKDRFGRLFVFLIGFLILAKRRLIIMYEVGRENSKEMLNSLIKSIKN